MEVDFDFLYLSIEVVAEASIIDEDLVLDGAEGLVELSQVAPFQVVLIEDSEDVIKFDNCDHAVFIRVDLTTQS